MGSTASGQGGEPVIHPTAVVDPAAEIGRDVRIGPFAVVGPHVRIGDGCEIGPHAVLDGHLTLGRRNRVFSSTVLGSPPQDLKYKGGECRLEIGDDNTFREFITVNPSTTPEGLTRIGNDCLLMACTHVAHDCVLGDHVILANGAVLGGHVRLDDWAFVGGLSAVHQFSVVGPHAFIGGATRLSHDVPPYVKVAGSPVRLAGVNTIGLERRGFSAETIARIKRAYRYLYRRGLRVEDALRQIVEEGEDEVAAAFQEFFRHSQRGIVR